MTRLLSFSLLIANATIARADCAAPSSPGVRICFPNQNSTVWYVPGLEMAATTASGAIARVEVWDNGTKRDNLRSLPGNLFDGSMKNGWNRVTINVWDTAGHLYQASRSFFVTGFGVGDCSTPSTAGINLCWPLSGSSQPNNTVPISATARGLNSTIKYVNIYVDGKFLVGQPGSQIETGSGMTAATHTVTARAADQAGHVFTTTNSFKTFYNFDCNPKNGACSPGIVINKPQGDDVPSTFTVQADVQNNPLPVTAMKIYVNGVVRASSTGPGITASFTLPANTTHYMLVKAWDTSGKVYASYQNLYVQ
jgi:hypothetical protein